MAIGIGVASVRSQDFTAIKQNEDNKGMSQQSHLTHNMQREEDQKMRQVREAENAEWQQKKFDAKEKGNGSYSGDGKNRKREKKEEQAKNGKAAAKGRPNFDMKI